MLNGCNISKGFLINQNIIFIFVRKNPFLKERKTRARGFGISRGIIEDNGVL